MTPPVKNLPQPFKSPSLCLFPFCFLFLSIPFFRRFLIETSRSHFSHKTALRKFLFEGFQCLFDVIIVNFYLHIFPLSVVRLVTLRENVILDLFYKNRCDLIYRFHDKEVCEINHRFFYNFARLVWQCHTSYHKATK